jgi:hypothetical protein
MHIYARRQYTHSIDSLSHFPMADTFIFFCCDNQALEVTDPSDLAMRDSVKKWCSQSLYEVWGFRCICQATFIYMAEEVQVSLL